MLTYIRFISGPERSGRDGQGQVFQERKTVGNAGDKRLRPFPSFPSWSNVRVKTSRPIRWVRTP